MRLVRTATCTSGEPVSPSVVAYSFMICGLELWSSAMISLFGSGVVFEVRAPAASCRHAGPRR